MKSKHIGDKGEGTEIIIPIPQLEQGKASVGDMMNQINDLTVVVNALIKGENIKSTPKKVEESTKKPAPSEPKKGEPKASS